ncbi:MAG: TetR/AcrR family transcriptional regulator [Wenzhouxiangellaceae bacterium]
MPRTSRREHLINVAIELFSEHGFHATGIDRILETAGVSKKTLYNHFRSKDELILAALRHYDGLSRNHFMAQVKKSADTPRGRLLAIFEVSRDWFMQNNFYGCIFINAVGEYAEEGNAIRQVCREYKRMMREFILELCQQAELANPEELAKELALLLEGAIVTAQVSGNADAAETAQRAAAVLINQATE